MRQTGSTGRPTGWRRSVQRCPTKEQTLPVRREGHFPFCEDSYDFCLSTSVFEHVTEYDKPISEISRVLRPGGWTLHVFPARWRPIEPHVFVPFGGRFQGPLLVFSLAKAGIRNDFSVTWMPLPWRR